MPAKLLEQVYGFGLPWTPSKEKLYTIRPMFADLIESGGAVGKCLQDFGRQFVGSTRPHLEDTMIQEFWQGQGATLSSVAEPKDSASRFRIQLQTPELNSNHFAMGCVRPRPLDFDIQLMPQSVNVGSRQEPKYRDSLVAFTYSEARKRLELVQLHQRSAIRFPKGVEAFAIGFFLVQERYQSVRLWMELSDGQVAMLTAKRNPEAKSITFLDYETVSGSGQEAILVGVFGPVPPQ